MTTMQDADARNRKHRIRRAAHAILQDVQARENPGEADKAPSARFPQDSRGVALAMAMDRIVKRSLPCETLSPGHSRWPAVACRISDENGLVFAAAATASVLAPEGVSLPPKAPEFGVPWLAGATAVPVKNIHFREEDLSSTELSPPPAHPPRESKAWIIGVLPPPKPGKSKRPNASLSPKIVERLMACVTGGALGILAGPASLLPPVVLPRKHSMFRISAIRIGAVSVPQKDGTSLALAVYEGRPTKRVGPQGSLLKETRRPAPKEDSPEGGVPFLSAADLSQATETLLRQTMNEEQEELPAEAAQARVWKEEALVSFQPREIPPPVDQGDVFVPWEPRFDASIKPQEIPSAPEHPTALARPAALADAAPPPPPDLRVPASILRSEALTDAQLEILGIAQGSFQRNLADIHGKPTDVRQGFLCSDGTGVGKGRMIAALAASAWLPSPQGGHSASRRTLWLGASPLLAVDALRDWKAVGGDPELFRTAPPRLEAVQGLGHLGNGVLYAGYSAIRNSSFEQAVLRWLSQDGDDPLLVLDECHALGGAEETQQGLAALSLQKALPRARVLYTSATALNGANSYRFAARLGLWQTLEAPFLSRSDFVHAAKAGGERMLEATCRELSLLGTAEVRTLSLKGVQQRPVWIKPDEEMIRIQDIWAQAWLVVCQNLERCIKEAKRSGMSKEEIRRIRAASSSIRQKFFLYLIGAFKSEALIQEIRKTLAQGEAPIVQLASTYETSGRRRLREIAQRQGVPIGEAQVSSDDDLSPIPDMIEQVRRTFPVARVLMKPDSKGEMRREEVVDDSGKPIDDPMRIAERAQAVKALQELPHPLPLLDRLVMEFGDDLSELTGRSIRIFPSGEDAQGRPQASVQVRSPSDRSQEILDFEQGRRKVLVFSDAGGIGRSYHADPDIPNSARRVHFVAETTFDSSALVQGLGRTHRAAQASAPILSLVSMELPGEARFHSAAARTLSRLGASTQGDNRAQVRNVPIHTRHMLDNAVGRDALAAVMQDLCQGETLGGMNADEFQVMTDLHAGEVHTWRPHVNLFLNRLMTLPVHLQEAVMADLDKARDAALRRRIENDDMDQGIDLIRSRFADEGLSIPLPGCSASSIVHVEAFDPSIPNPSRHQTEQWIRAAVVGTSSNDQQEGFPPAAWLMGGGQEISATTGKVRRTGRFLIELPDGTPGHPEIKRFPCLEISRGATRLVMASRGLKDRDSGLSPPVPDPWVPGSLPAQPEAAQPVRSIVARELEEIIHSMVEEGSPEKKGSGKRRVSMAFLEGRVLPFLPMLALCGERTSVRRMHIHGNDPAGRRLTQDASQDPQRTITRTVTGVLLSPHGIPLCHRTAWEERCRPLGKSS